MSYPDLRLDAGLHRPAVVDQTLSEHFSHKIKQPADMKWRDVYDWCVETLGAPAFQQADNSPFYAYDGDAAWSDWGVHWYFRDERAAIMFRLRFG